VTGLPLASLGTSRTFGELVAYLQAHAEGRRGGARAAAELEARRAEIAAALPAAVILYTVALRIKRCAEHRINIPPGAIRHWVVTGWIACSSSARSTCPER